MTLHRIAMSIPGIASSVAAVSLALADKYAEAVIAGTIGTIIQAVITFLLTGSIVRLLDDSRFLFIPKVARNVNGKPSTVGLDQPDQEFMGTEYQAMIVAEHFARTRYPGRPDIRAARTKVSLDEIMLNPESKQQ